MSHELWSCCLGWHQRLAHWQKLDVSLNWSGIRVQGQASSKPYVMTHLYLTCSSVLPRIWNNECSFFGGGVLLVFNFDHNVCVHIQTVFTLRCLLMCQMCQCNKVLYTVEFSTFPVIWLFMGWTLGEALSAVVHLYSEHPNVYTVINRQAKEKLSVLSHSAVQYSVHL